MLTLTNINTMQCNCPIELRIEVNNIFEQDDLLKAYDRILLKAKHYQSVISIHQRELRDCRNVIDLGCGTGNPTMELLRNKTCVTAVDLSQKSLDILKGKATNDGCGNELSTLCADITNLTQEIPSESFDGANSSIVAHLLNDYKKHAEESYRVLKPGGKFVITARCAGQEQERLVESVRESLVENDIFKEFRTDFELIRDNLLLTAGDRSSSLFSPEDALALLTTVGFSCVEEISNETIGVMYSLVAQK